MRTSLPTFLKSLDPKGAVAGLLAMVLVLAGILAGSRNLRDYDPALLTYTLGTLFAAFAVAYRSAVWLQRPATRFYCRQGWVLAFRSRGLLPNLLMLIRGFGSNLVAQNFIRRRSRARWFAHFCFAWGCMLATTFTFPLVFGWVHFESRLQEPEIYRVILFGMAVDEFHVASIKRYIIFNLLNLSAVMVIAGASLALRRRLKEAGSIARQQFGNDLAPLLLLLAIAVTGLMLTFSTHALQGYGYGAVALVHALTVVATLLYLPFGKLFHIFQRPLQLSVSVYQRANQQMPPAQCRVCGQGFAGAMHVQDLKDVLAEVGLDWNMTGPVPHYSEVCPRCRRRLMGFSQGRVVARSRATDFENRRIGKRLCGVFWLTIGQEQVHLFIKASFAV